MLAAGLFKPTAHEMDGSHITHQLNKSDDLLYRSNPQTGATRSAEFRDSIFSVSSERGHLCGP